MSLEDLRARLNLLDRRLLELVAERQAISRRSPRSSARPGSRPATTAASARCCSRRARDAGRRYGVSPALGESILRCADPRLADHAGAPRVAAQGRGSGRRALVIGGPGKMGRWFADFMASQGFAVEIADPAGAGRPGYECVAGLAAGRARPRHHRRGDAAAASRTKILAEMAGRRPRGRGLRRRLAEDTAAQRARGAPRCGLPRDLDAPDVRPRHRAAVRPPRDLRRPRRRGDAGRARALFGSTMAELVVMSLDEHDRLIAYVLGLSHALNIAFFTALAESGEAAPRLAEAVVDDLRRPARRGDAASPARAPSCTSRSRASTTTARKPCRHCRLPSHGSATPSTTTMPVRSRR